ncbi:ATPase [Taibaiella lutea]|uniref:ATPase n=1 Tax=Taibaiella lutea TaxID=2608001 RepID=A0A5M6CFL1_9BACT|nr:SRPBCC domain-containing protein [Taibaiella lutea]KAA5532235.1 ATPase [Taibaiella lutea]
MSANKRTDTGSRLINAPAAVIYEAYLNPESVMSWRPPEGMKCEIFEFNPHQGGIFKMCFSFIDEHHDTPGKTTAHADVFSGIFEELKEDRKIVEAVNFESDNSAFAGTMKVITQLETVPHGTFVTIRCEDVPSGIKESDHQKGIQSTLENLAKFTEQ